MKILLQKEAFKAFLFALVYGICFYLFQLFLFQRDMVDTVPHVDHLNIYDAGWYQSIARNGYEFKESASNSAFYMLFPIVWRVTDTSEHGMAFLNILFFSIGFGFFCDIFKLSQKNKFLWLTTPSLYFAFIPYSEALFILLMTLSLWAIYKDKRYMAWVSLFLVSLVRPVSMIMLPAFLIAEVITNNRQHFLRSIAVFLYKYGIPLVLGQVFFIWYQYHETGVWFAFFKQEKNWGHVFAWPTLPFNSMYGMKLLWLNAAAMFVGFISMLMLFAYGFKWLFKNMVARDKLLTISYLYLTAILFVTILFNPVWGTYTTNVYDIHRYVFATPFFWVFIHHYAVEKVYTAKDYAVVFALSNLFWLLFESYKTLHYTLYFNGATVLILLYMMNTNKKFEWPPMVIACVNVFVQVCMMQFFMKGVYPG